MEAVFLETEERRLSQDQRAELWLGALVCGVVIVLLAMVVFIVAQAWPSFAHNGLHWFGPGGNVDSQIDGDLQLRREPAQAGSTRSMPGR